MKISIDSGKYILAVSGGVDSTVLLDLVAQNKNLDIVVAHFDHGIRKNSGDDLEFTAAKAGQYGLKFSGGRGKLGAAASEEVARGARYRFLRQVADQENAQAIVTAHHQDDLIETAIINILRGTGRKGLSSLSSRPGMLRPLLGFTKADILAYAKKHGLLWREDPSNADTKYLRNRVRREVLPSLGAAKRLRLLNIIKQSHITNIELDELLDDLLPSAGELQRDWLNSLPHGAAKEFLASMLRVKKIYFDTDTLERLIIGLKTKPAGTRLDISGGWVLIIDKNQIRLHPPNQV